MRVRIIQLCIWRLTLKGPHTQKTKVVVICLDYGVAIYFHSRMYTRNAPSVLKAIRLGNFVSILVCVAQFDWESNVNQASITG